MLVTSTFGSAKLGFSPLAERLRGQGGIPPQAG
jgi:hypothetical protein